MGEVFAGRRNSRAWAALKSSMPRTVSVLSTTRTSLVAEFDPMLTWSSWPCDEGIESQEAGQQRPLFWLTMLAAVYCGIMKPLFRPGLATRYFGKPRRPWIS